MPRKEKAQRNYNGRPIWRGHITFGLVQVPVVLLSAEKRDDLHFRLLDGRDHARIKYQRINEVSGEEVPWNEIVKAYEYEDENYIVVTEADFKRAAVEATRAVEIEQFVDEHEISPIYYETPYYLAPDKKGDKGYALLREALKRTRKIGIARVVIRTREYLSALRVEGDALCLDLLRFHQEIREAPEDLPSSRLKQLDISTRDVDMAIQLIDSMGGKWNPREYKDQYKAALLKWIEKKAKSGGVTPPEPDEPLEEDVGRIINITDLLQKSLKKGGARGKGKATSARRVKTTRRKAAG